MGSKGKKNVYICERRCGNEIISVNRDEGVTPFTIRCKSENHSAGTIVFMRSSLYRVDQSLTPTMEWIKPTPEEYREYLKEDKVKVGSRSEKAIKEHIDKGGLIPRMIESKKFPLI